MHMKQGRALIQPRNAVTVELPKQHAVPDVHHGNDTATRHACVGAHARLEGEEHGAETAPVETPGAAGQGAAQAIDVR